jgi:hypothetical protein
VYPARRLLSALAPLGVDIEQIIAKEYGAGKLWAERRACGEETRGRS